jgi:hypothetical protein
MTDMPAVFLGPVSGAGGRGNGDGGPVVTALFILVGCWMFVGTWKDYLEYRGARQVPPVKVLARVLGLSALAAFLVVDGLWSLLIRR